MVGLTQVKRRKHNQVLNSPLADDKVNSLVLAWWKFEHLGLIMNSEQKRVIIS